MPTPSPQTRPAKPAIPAQPAQPAQEPQQPVLLIHGIQSAGLWLDDISPMLKWFFRPVPVKYTQFRHLGPLLVVSEPALAVPGVLLVVFADSLPLLSALLWIVIGCL